MRGGLTIDTPVAVSLLVPGDSILATVADADRVEVRQVAWRRGGTTVSSTLDYTLEASNFGEPLEVNVTYADGMGHTETLSSTILLPSQIPLVRFADLHGQLMTGLRAGADYFLRVSPALVGLPFDVLVDGTAVSSGFAMDYYGLSARAEGETVTVRVNRGNGLYGGLCAFARGDCPPRGPGRRRRHVVGDPSRRYHHVCGVLL